MSAVSPASGQVKQPHSSGFILGNLAIGHAISHWYNQSLFVILPIIQDSLNFSNVQLGALSTIRNISSGVANIPAGFAIDMAKNQWGLILTSCMFLSAISFTLVAFSPNYVILAIVMVIVSVPGTLWHMPAIAAISQRFPERRGFGLSIHGAGGNVGNIVGPLIAGALLGFMAWRQVTLFYVIPSLLVAAVVWWSLRDIGTSDAAPNEKKPLSTRVHDAGNLLRNRTILALMLVIIIRTMGFNSLNVWVPKYLHDSVSKGGLGMGVLMVGLNTSLLTGLGVISAPPLVFLSDRYGRKAVLIPGLAITALLALAIGHAGDALVLTLVILVIGLFTYSLAQILQATVLDHINRGTEGAAMGLILGSSGIIASFSPILAAVIVDEYGLSSVFYYNAALIAAAAAVLFLAPLKRPARAPTQVKAPVG